jgi:hypothetical protein
MKITYAGDPAHDQVIGIFEVLHPGLTLPTSPENSQVTEKVFTPEQLTYYKTQSESMQFIKNQMTVLGSELKARYKNFFSALDSRNIVVKNLKTKENDQALKSHLKGLSGVWDDMQDIDTSKASDNEVLPPFKRVRND